MGLLGLLIDAGRAGKDAFLARHLLGRLNMYMDFGKVRQLKLDSRAKRIDVVLDLKGETEPVSVSLYDYCVKKAGERLTVEVGRITASREWIAILGQELAANRPFEIPVSAKYEWLVNLLV